MITVLAILIGWFFGGLIVWWFTKWYLTKYFRP